MLVSSVQDLMKATLELGRIQNRSVEFSGMLLDVLVSGDTLEQLNWVKRFVGRHYHATVTQAENYDAVKVEF